MRPIVNMTEEDRATDIGNRHKNLVKIARVVLGISSRTDRQTDILITILRNRSRGRSNSSRYFVEREQSESLVRCGVDKSYSNVQVSNSLDSTELRREIE